MKLQLENLQSKKPLKVIMPDEVLLKIQKLCSIIHHVEWSGILLYETEGSMQDSDNFVITLRDIILMEKGTQTYTSFNYNEKKRDNSGIEDRHIDYVIEHEEAELYRLGLIHSHNNMKTYFSSVDDAELAENAGSYNIFLSLIVNNNMDFEAKVAFLSRAEAVAETEYVALDEKGNPYSIVPAKLKTYKEKVFTIDCEIVSNKDTLVNPYETYFDKNIREVLEKADHILTKPKTTSYSTNKNTINTNVKPVLPYRKVVMPTTPTKTVSSTIDQETLAELNLDLFEDESISTIRSFFATNKKDQYANLIDLVLAYSKSSLVFKEDFTLHVQNKVSESYILEEIIEILEYFESSVNFLTETLFVLRDYADALIVNEEMSLSAIFIDDDL